MSKKSIAYVLASAFAASILATSCAPVSNSVPKTSRNGRNFGLKNGDSTNSDQIVHAQYVVSSRTFRESNYQKKLENLPKGLKQFELSRSKVENLKEEKSTLLELPDVNGAVQIFAVIEVNVSEDTIERKKLDQVKTQWKRIGVTEFALKLVDDEKSNSKRDYVSSNLEGVTVFYRTLE